MSDHDLESKIFDSGVDVLSLDVFDTLLLRNLKPEPLRFWEAANAKAILLSDQLGRTITAKEIFIVHVWAHRTAYRLAPSVNGERDASIKLILGLMLQAFYAPLTEQLYRELCEIELAYEIENLTLNHEIYGAAAAFWRKKGRVFFLSDMYLESSHIEKLLEHFCPQKIWDHIYVSSECSLTKSGGGLYDIFLREQGLSADKVLHLGDNHPSDVVMARKRGLKAIHTPRSLVFRKVTALLRFGFGAWHKESMT